MSEAHISLETREQIKFFGQQIEERAVGKEEMLLGEPERIWFRGLLERKNVDLGVLLQGKTVDSEGKEVHAVVAQGDKLERALGGRSALVDYVITVLKRLVASEKISEVDDFVRNYFKDNEYDDGRLIKYDLNSGKVWDCRMVAIVSGTNRLLKIIAAENEEKAKEWQNNDQTKKFLRDRILKGHGKEVEGKLTRSLPADSVGVMLEILTTS